MTMSHSFQYLISVEDPSWQNHALDLEQIIAHAAEIVLPLADVPALFKQRLADINIILTDNDAVQTLNADYREKDKPTNILTFPQIDCCDQDDLDMQANMPAEMPLIFGDLYLAYDVVKSECAEQEKTFEAHLSHLIIHGILHLLGYDHIETDEAEEMEAIEIKAMVKLGFENPYADMALVDRMRS